MLLVIGYGNPLRTDDGVGHRVVNDLARLPHPPGALALIGCHQLTPELAEPISRAMRVIFIDALHGGIPGHITRRELLPEPTDGSMSHHVTPQSLLHQAQQLYNHRPEANLYTICGEDFGYGEGLSARVEAAVPGLVRFIQQQVSMRRESSHA